MSRREFQPTEHPQLFVPDTEAHVECRVYNWKLLKDSTGTVIDVQRSYRSWTDAVAIVLLAWFLIPSDVSLSSTNVIIFPSEFGRLSRFIGQLIYFSPSWRCLCTHSGDARL